MVSNTIIIIIKKFPHYFTALLNDEQVPKEHLLE